MRASSTLMNNLTRRLVLPNLKMEGVSQPGVNCEYLRRNFVYVSKSPGGPLNLGGRDQPAICMWGGAGRGGRNFISSDFLRNIKIV
ncbi:hypothetical protein AMTR_s00022p00043400 [Amborella trichopoda]|uniref:Uncharacterized protein n=1 Tax=Amborella trichopoda TaxID=13333 RepID=W1PUB5_AMBTC|nr:hypothetical protein AMTR_s00022p00043400 [Amborella trichopoda]